MLKNRITTKEYKELTPTIILRKSRRRINVMAVVAFRLRTIKDRKSQQPAITANYGEARALGYGFTKGGYPVNRNGVPINSNGRNALGGRIK